MIINYNIKTINTNLVLQNEFTISCTFVRRTYLGTETKHAAMHHPLKMAKYLYIIICHIGSICSLLVRSSNHQIIEIMKCQFDYVPQNTIVFYVCTSLLITRNRQYKQFNYVGEDTREIWEDGSSHHDFFFLYIILLHCTGDKIFFTKINQILGYIYPFIYEIDIWLYMKITVYTTVELYYNMYNE